MKKLTYLCSSDYNRHRNDMLELHRRNYGSVAETLYDSLYGKNPCGAPLLGINDRLSLDLTEKKLADGRRAGADYLCVACPYCQMQFDRVQEMLKSPNPHLASMVFPQLLGLAMNIDDDALGMNMNMLDINSIKSFLE